MATITLVYSAPRGLMSSADFVVKFESVVVEAGELELLGMQKIDDVTVLTVQGAERTIKLNVTPQGEQQFPTDALKKDATRKLYVQTLALRTPARVTAAEPVVT